MNQANHSDFTNNTYEMNYINPPGSNPSVGLPVYNAQQNYGFQYTYTPPDGSPPKYDDVVNGNYVHQNAYAPTAPASLNPSNFDQNEDYNYFPRSPNPVQHINVRIEPESGVQSQPQVQRSRAKDNVRETNKKPKTNWWYYILIRILVVAVIGGLIRAVVYAAYK